MARTADQVVLAVHEHVALPGLIGSLVTGAVGSDVIAGKDDLVAFDHDVLALGRVDRQTAHLAAVAAYLEAAARRTGVDLDRRLGRGGARGLHRPWLRVALDRHRLRQDRQLGHQGDLVRAGPRDVELDGVVIGLRLRCLDRPPQRAGVHVTHIGHLERRRLRRGGDRCHHQNDGSEGRKHEPCWTREHMRPFHEREARASAPGYSSGTPSQRPPFQVKADSSFGRMAALLYVPCMNVSDHQLPITSDGDPDPLRRRRAGRRDRPPARARDPVGGLARLLPAHQGVQDAAGAAR